MQARFLTRTDTMLRPRHEVVVAAGGLAAAVAATLFLIEALRCATLLMYGIRACVP